MAEPDDKRYDEEATKAGARAIRGIYLALIAEGFTEAQAIEIVKGMLPNAKR